MNDSPWVWGALAALAGALFLGARFEAWRKQYTLSVRGRRLQKRGAKAERDAERWLTRAGYKVLGRQVRNTYTLQVEGKGQPIEVCADLMVQRGGERFIVEVKTGERGGCAANAPTRRQLLEYQLAYDVAGILLMDGDRAQMQRVRFPMFREPPRRQSPWLSRLAWLLLGAATALWLTDHLPRGG